MLGAYIYNDYIFFSDLSLGHYSVHVSCSGLYFKFYFMWYEYVYFHFLVISICMEYIFPTPHIESVCVPRSEVGLYI